MPSLWPPAPVGCSYRLVERRDARRRAMRGSPGWWIAFAPDFYLERREESWVVEERDEWVRCFVCDRGAFVCVHGFNAPRLVAALGRENSVPRPQAMPTAERS